MLASVQIFKLQQTKHQEQADASAVRHPSISQRAKEGPYSWNCFCTGYAQVGHVQCEPLQLVALKTKVC